VKPRPWIRVVLGSLALLSLRGTVECREARLVAVSTLCLLDDDAHRTREYLLQTVDATARRQRHDLIVAPLTPFLSFREGNEAEDLRDFADLARQHRTYLTFAMMESAAEMIAERARRMKAYVLIAGVDIGERAEPEGRRSHAYLWNRSGEIVFKQPIYWTRGYSKIKVYDTDFAHIGVHICGDAYVGEIDRVSALNGEELILDGSQMWDADQNSMGCYPLRITLQRNTGRRSSRISERQPALAFPWKRSDRTSKEGI